MKLPSLLPAIGTAIADGTPSLSAGLDRRSHARSAACRPLDEEREALEIDLSPREYV
jgi:hypothetical protein